MNTNYSLKIGQAEDWDSWHISSAPKYPHEKVIQFCFRNFAKDQRMNIRVLDLGCGNGVNTRFLVQEGFKVHGIDFSQRAIENAKNLLSSQSLKADFQTLSIDQLDLIQAKFDLVISAGVFDSAGIEAATDCIKQLPNLLEKNSKGLFIFASDLDYRINSKHPPRIYGYSENEVRKIFDPYFSKVNYDRYITTYEGGSYQQNDWIITIGT